jgi:hypothetical protein
MPSLIAIGIARGFETTNINQWRNLWTVLERSESLVGDSPLELLQEFFSEVERHLDENADSEKLSTFHFAVSDWDDYDLVKEFWSYAIGFPMQ